MQTKKFFQANFYPRIRPIWLRRSYLRLLDSRLGSAVANWKYIRSFKLIDDLNGMNAAARQVVTDLRTSGVAISHISELFPVGTLEDLRDAFYELLDNSDRQYSGKPYIMPLGDKTFRLRDDDIFTTVATNEQLAAVAGRYMGMIPRFARLRRWHTFSIQQQEPISSQLWHRDFDDTMFTKVFIYLNDVGPQNGALEYVKDTHRGGCYGEILTRRRQARGVRDYPTNGDLAMYHKIIKRNAVSCTGKAGTMIFADTFGIHRGGQCQTGTRDLVMLQFTTNANLVEGGFCIDDDFSGFETEFMARVFGVR